MRDGNDLPDKAGQTWCLTASMREVMPRLVEHKTENRTPECTQCGTNRKTARADSPCCPDVRGSLGGNPCPLDSRSANRFHRGPKQPILSCEPRGSLVSEGGAHNRYALLGSRETHPSVLMTDRKQSGTQCFTSVLVAGRD